MNVTRKSQVKIMGHWVRVPNCFIGRKWSAEKIARAEVQAERLGDLQNFVMKSPLFPLFVVSVFVGCLILSSWAIETVVDMLL